MDTTSELTAMQSCTMEVMLHPDLERLLKQKSKPKNYKKDERQTVYPIKKHEEIIAMANWLLAHKGKKYVLAFTLGINLGLRANELLSLRMNQVFASDGSVRMSPYLEDTSDGIIILQSKTGKYRTVFLNAACKDVLEWCFPEREAYLHCNGYLFPSREGGAIQVGTFRKALKDAAKACGVRQNVGTHTCRKTWGWHQYKYNCDKANMDITMLQRAFGHSSPEVTLRYLGITDEEDKALYHNMCIHVVSDKDFENHDCIGAGNWR